MNRKWFEWICAASVLAACGGDASSSGSGGASSTGRSIYGDCPGDSGETCTGEDQWEQCVLAKCETVLVSCYGPSFQTGSYGGSCGATMTCVMGCACGDAACELTCGQQASQECISCSEEAEACSDSSGCAEPVCGTGGSSGSGTGGSSGSEAGGSSGAGTGGSSPAICPYSVSNFSCEGACTQLKQIASKCKDDPTVPASEKAALEIASQGTGAACNVSCAADSPSYPNQWKCFQGVPVSADCSAIAACTLDNCP